MDICILIVGQHAKYLGKKLRSQNPERTEVNSRIAFVWKNFHSLKQEHIGKKYSLNDRIRLVNGAVTPTVLYGCESWTLNIRKRLNIS